jgi:ABC-type Fe3+ transport system permease subunit
VAGFVLAMVGAGLMVLSVLLLSFVCVVLAVLAIVYSRRGKRKVEAGETRKHKGLAQAGYVVGIVTLVIAIPVTLLEIVFVIAYATDEQFREDFQDDWDQEFNNTILLVVPILRGLARLFT